MPAFAALLELTPREAVNGDEVRVDAVVLEDALEEALLAETMNWFEGKNMACTSDYPHWDSSGVSGVVRYLKQFTEINEETRLNFFSRTAVDALGLDA